MVLEVLVSVSHFAATTPAIVGVCLGATLFLVGIISVTLFFYRRKSTGYRKSGVYLTTRSPNSEDFPLQSQLIIPRKTSGDSGSSQHYVRTPHLVMKKSPSPPFYPSPSPRTSPLTPPTDDSEGGVKSGGHNPRSIAIRSNPQAEDYAEIHGTGFISGGNSCGKGSRGRSPHLVSTSYGTTTSMSSPSMHVVYHSHIPSTTPTSRSSRSPRTSPTSPTASTISSSSDMMNQRNGNAPTSTHADVGMTLPGGRGSVTGGGGEMAVAGVAVHGGSGVGLSSGSTSGCGVGGLMNKSGLASSTEVDSTGRQQQQGTIPSASRGCSGGNETANSSREGTTVMVSAAPSNATSQNLSGGGEFGLGTLFFKMSYKEDQAALVITVMKCENLPVKDTSLMTCDPYVKLQLLPEKQQRVKTRVLRHTRQPVYEEEFTFYGLQQNQIQGTTLHFVVLSFDRFSRDDVVGEAFFTLASVEIPKNDNQQLEISMDIQPRNMKMRTQGRGEVLLSLCWQPTANRLSVVVLKARNLPQMDVTGLADPYVKLYLLYDGQRIAKKKTHIKKRTLNPVFNESFVFDLPPAASQSSTLDKVALQVLVLDWDRVTKNEVIGRLELGNGAVSPTATHHWTEVLNCPRRQIAEWHKLRD